MRAWFLILAIGLMAPSALAQEQQDVPQEVIDKLSRDLQGLAPSQAENPFWTDLATSPLSPRVALEQVPVHAKADPQSPVLIDAPAGDILRVLDEQGGFLKVLTPSGEGWIAKDKTLPVRFSPDAQNVAFFGLVDDEWIRSQIAEMVDKAGELFNEYQSNKYLRISGFTIDVKYPPGISIQFEVLKPE